MKTETIQWNLKRYFWKTTVFFMILLFFSNIILICNQVRQEYENKKLYQLNYFYSGLEGMNINYIRYTRYGGEEQYQSIIEDGGDLEIILADISEIPAGEAFSREVRDTFCLFQKYVRNLKQIRSLKIQQNDSDLKDKTDILEIQAEINLLQSKSLSLYTQINRAFQSQYSKILVWSQKNNDVWVHFMEKAIVVLLCVAASVILYQTLNASILGMQIGGPVVKLAKHMRNLQKSDIHSNEQYKEIELTDIANRETETLVNGFNAMIRQLKENAKEREDYLKTEIQLKMKTVENLRIQEKLKSNELRVIQSRINPHFLFNTLNLVSQFAYMEGASKTVELLGKTASLLRYYLDFSDKKVPLGRELEELQNYVSLQQIRFGNRIEFEFRIEETIRTYLVPSQILQPIVENAIIHGVVGYSSGGRILIEGILSEDETEIQINIVDNGIGMSEEQIQNIYAAFAEDAQTGRHIGLGSVNTKLKYDTGRKKVICITSNPGVETVVGLRLPIIKS